MGAPFLVWVGGWVSGVVFRLVWRLFGCVAFIIGILVVV